MSETYRVRPGHCLKGTVSIPGDKSISHRAVILASLAQGTSHISGFLFSDDCLHTLDCFQKMGVSVTQQADGKLTIESGGAQALSHPSQALYVGNSGTSIRLLSGVLAALSHIKKPVRITGDASIEKRPMDRILLPLRQMGAVIAGVSDTYAPLTISPQPLHGITYHMPVASAQVKSCILLAGLFARGTMVVHEKVETRDHTECMFESMGVSLIRDARTFTVTPPTSLMARDIKVPGDISSAAFFIVAALIVPGADVTIRYVGMNPTRNKCIDVLKAMGGDIHLLNHQMYGHEPVCDIRICHSKLHGIAIGGDIIPNIIDEIPILCLAAACAEGETVVSDAAELRVKESDRIFHTVRLLSALGVAISEKDDGMVIVGPNTLSGGIVDSAGDHRLAMTAAIAGLVAKDAVTVTNTACIATSFPTFWHVLMHLFV